MYIYLYCNIIPTAPNKALDAVSIMSYNSLKRALCKITCLSDTHSIIAHWSIETVLVKCLNLFTLFNLVHCPSYLSKCLHHYIILFSVV